MNERPVDIGNIFTKYASPMPLRSTRSGSTVAIALLASASPYRSWLWINHGTAITNAAGTTANRFSRSRQGAPISTITAVSTIAIANPLSFDKNPTALAAAVGFLSKLNGLAIAIVLTAVIVLIGAPWRDRLKRLAVVPAAFVIAVPWLIHNQLRYGDALASKAIATVLPLLVERKGITDVYFMKAFPITTGRSFIAVFGWMNVLAPTGVYW